MDACCISWVLPNWSWPRVCDFQRRDPISSRNCCPRNIWRLVDQHCVKQLDFRVLCWENNVEDWVNRRVWEAVSSVNLLEYAPITETAGLLWFYVIYTYTGVPKPMSQTSPGYSPSLIKQKFPINMGPKVNRFRDIHCCVEIREMPWSTRNTLLSNA